MAQARTYDHVYWYLNEVSSRVVAKSGIPSDWCHIGKLALQSFKDDLDFIAQIDGGTGESETNGSLLKRSIQCAISFREMGLKQGDVLVLMAPNHLDLAVPFYAALYLGIVIAPINRIFKGGNLENLFNACKPSIVMCHSEKTPDVRTALETLNIKAKIVTFDEQNHGSCLADLLTAGDEEIDDFKAEDFNAEESIAVIITTSGTTAPSKEAAFTHKTVVITGANSWARFIKFPSPTRAWLILSPLHWLTATRHFLTSPFIKYTRLQTSKAVDMDHTRYLINTYKPTGATMIPPMIVDLLKSRDNGLCDMTCFDIILTGGSAVDKKTLEFFKVSLPTTTVVYVFGMTELGTAAFQGDCPMGSCGKPSGIYQYRLVHLDTHKDIEDPYVSGELWIKGPMFKEYYNNPKESKEAFAEDGWFKTGDIFYRDEHWNFFFIERKKLLLKYKNVQISPTEIEGVIRAHPNVKEVAVAGVPDPECCGDLLVACVLPEPGTILNAQEIKDLVKEKLSGAKQLRGGVAFVSGFLLTTSGKIARSEVNDMIKHLKFE